MLDVRQVTKSFDGFQAVGGVSLTVPAGSILPLFAQLGLVDIAYRPKPALAVWDSVRGTPLVP